jgi:L-2-hydroxyglutarate oxidase LhgO
VINAAGLGADAVALMAGVDTGALGIRQHMCKGEYFAVSVAPGAGVRGLVYPSPDADRVGLGIHSVVDLGGGIRLGPNAFYVDRVDYTVDGSHAAAFHAAVTEFLPFLRLTDLAPAMAGIRPKLAGPGEAARDFFIGHMDRAGAPGLIHLAGIESPGLTASPAIARLVAALAVEALDA